MKKIIKFIFPLLILLLSNISCNDAIDIVQDGEFSNDATFLSVSDMQKYLDGSVYSSVNISNEIKFTSVFTDEVGLGSANSGQDQTLHRFYLDVSDGYVSGIWISHYLLINRVNRLLQGATKVTPNPEVTGEVDKYNSILAQARALRAFAYIQLEAYFSTDMKDSTALGVILLDHVPTVAEKLPRAKNSDIFSLIEADLNFAESNLTSVLSYYYINKASIAAIKARYYLYRGDYTLAKQYANSAISLSGLTLTKATPIPSGNSSLSPGVYNGTSNPWHTSLNSTSSTNPYRKMWNDSSQGEVLFALARPTVGTWENIASLYTTNTTSATGSPLFDMGRNLFNILVSNSGDIRKYVFIDPSAKVDGNYLTSTSPKTTDVLVIDKYPGKGTTALRNDIKLFRLSEMYFILAECATKENDLPTAANYIKAVRDARNYLGPQTAPVYADATAAWTDILLERRLELCFEGHRYIDIKRLGTLAGQTNSIDRNEVDDIIKPLPLTIPNSDHRFTLPIPLDETLANPTIQQNPGY